MLYGTICKKVIENSIKGDSLSFTVVFRANSLIRESKHLAATMIRIISLKLGRRKQIMNIK